MNILITGGAGYIGSHTCVELLRNGYEITLIDNYSNSTPAVISRIEGISGKKLRYYECDLLDREQLEAVFMNEHFDGIIHFAGLKSVPESVNKPQLYYRNNLISTLNLLEAMAKYGVNKLVFSSSATVYGINNSVPYQEEMPVSATNPYGWTKVMIEQILKDYSLADKTLKIAILRYFNPIGADSSGLLGEKPEGIPANLMPYLCLTAARRLPYLKVYGTDFPTNDGTGIRDYLHISDLVNGHIKALEKLDFIKGTEIYNLGSGKGTSVYELLNIFQKVSGIKIKSENFDRRPGDISESYADVKKAEKELQWKTERSLEDMCRDSWNYVKTEFEIQQ